MRLNGAQITCGLLWNQGIRIISGIPGGSNLPLYDALFESKIDHVLARSEQGAGFITHGMARSTGKVAVCFATSGPGATNLITPIADAKLDSVPLVAITGQVPLSLLGTDAFQEIDTYGMTQSITKHNYLIRSASELLWVIPEAFKIAASGRPGPVVIDLPKNVQTEILEFENWPDIGCDDPPMEANQDQLDALISAIKVSKRPLVYFGAGVINSNSSRDLLEFIRKIEAPATSSLLGIGVLSSDEDQYLGMLGMHGSIGTNMLIEEADLLIAIGARFDDRATGKVDSFGRNAKIAHIDVDAAEINKIKHADIVVVGDVGSTLRRLNAKLTELHHPDWLARAACLKESHSIKIEAGFDHPTKLVRLLSDYAGETAILSTDVGQHQMWAAQAYKVRQPRSFLTSGGLGTMGFGLPAAIGAALANPSRKSILLTGDGSIQMNIQELATLSERNLNVCVVIFDNGNLGLVRQQQRLFYNSHFSASGFSQRPDFSQIAKGYGIPSEKIARGENPDQALARALRTNGPYVLVFDIDPDAMVFPMVPPGRSNIEALSG